MNVSEQRLAEWQRMSATIVEGTNLEKGREGVDAPYLEAGVFVWPPHTYFYEWCSAKDYLEGVHEFTLIEPVPQCGRVLSQPQIRYMPPHIYLLKALAEEGELDSMKDKVEDKPLAGLWRNDPDTPEGKYLVKRRDGTVVEWPNFVLGAKDPAAPVALRAYADECRRLGMNEIYCRDILHLSQEFEEYRTIHGNGDPDRGRHRRDDSGTIAEMRWANIHPFQPDHTAPDYCRCGAHKSHLEHGVIANDLKQVIDCDAAKIHELILERNEAREKLAAIFAILNDPTLDYTAAVDRARALK